MAIPPPGAQLVELADPLYNEKYTGWVEEIYGP